MNEVVKNGKKRYPAYEGKRDPQHQRRKQMRGDYEFLNHDARLRDVTAGIEKYHLRHFVKKLEEHGYYKFLDEVRKNIGRVITIPFEKTDKKVGDLVEETLQFYKEFDIEFYQKIDSALKNPQIEKHFHEPGTVKENSNVLFEKRFIRPSVRAINLYPQANILGNVAVVHEFAHVAGQRFQECKRQKTDLTAEIPSLFMEKVYRSYLLESGKIDQAEYDNLVNMDKVLLQKHINEMFDEKDLCNFMPFVLDVRNFNESIRDILQYYKDEKRVEGILHAMRKLSGYENNMHGAYLCRYVIGELVSCVLYDEFKIGPKTATIKFKRFVDNMCELKLEDSCKMLLGDNYMQKIKQKFCQKEEIK